MTGLTSDQVDRLVLDVYATGGLDPARRRAVGPYRAVLAVLLYLRHNPSQALIAELFGCSQSTVSRLIARLMPIISTVLTPTADRAAERDLRSTGHTVERLDQPHIGPGFALRLGVVHRARHRRTGQRQPAAPRADYLWEECPCARSRFAHDCVSRIGARLWLEALIGDTSTSADRTMLRSSSGGGSARHLGARFAPPRQRRRPGQRVLPQLAHQAVFARRPSHAVRDHLNSPRDLGCQARLHNRDQRPRQERPVPSYTSPWTRSPLDPLLIRVAG